MSEFDNLSPACHEFALKCQSNLSDCRKATQVNDTVSDMAQSTCPLLVKGLLKTAVQVNHVGGLVLRVDQKEIFVSEHDVFIVLERRRYPLGAIPFMPGGIWCTLSCSGILAPIAG